MVYGDHTMYTIKQAAARTGVSIPVLRAWQRRYGIVEPKRTEAGYRLYTEGDLARIRVMRQMVSDGWSPSAAAEALASRTDYAIQAAQERDAPRPSAPDAGPLAGRLVAAAAQLDTSEIERILDEMGGLGSFEHVAERHLLPALVAIGAAWEAGEVGVAGEHAASHAVLRRLSAAFEAAGRSRADERPILVGLPPGSRHELGALAFAAAARRTGLPVVYLGADLPVEDWVRAALSSNARGAVVALVTERDREAGDAVLRALARDAPQLVTAVGGRGAAEFITPPGVIRLPDSLVDAVDALRAMTPV